MRTILSLGMIVCVFMILMSFFIQPMAVNAQIIPTDTPSPSTHTPAPTAQTVVPRTTATLPLPLPTDHTTVPPTKTNTPVPLPTDTPRDRPTQTSTPAPTNTSTPTQLPTNTSTPTAVPTNTLAPTPTETAVPTVVNVPAIISTDTPAPTRTATAAPTATPFPSTIVLNEVLSKSKNVDWNRNGVKDTEDEWIELYNTGTTTTDVSGWKIDTGAQTLAFTIPSSTTIAARGFLVYYRSQTRLTLDSANQLRLLHPDGSVADAVQYAQLDDDRVHARSIDGGGVWRLGCAPSPGASNCQTLATTTSSFDLPYFRENIASPTANFEPTVVATNSFLAILLALAMGFFGNLLSDALEAHEEHVARFLGPLTQAELRIKQVGSVFDKWMTASRLAWLGFVIKLAVILLIYGTIRAYLDPGFSFINHDGWLLILALGLSSGLIGVVDDLTSYIILRAYGGNGVIRMHSGNFLVVVLSTLFSRLTGIVPGLLLGNPAGIEEVKDPGVGKYLDLLAVLATVLVAFTAWFLAPLFSSDAWFNTLFLLIFAAGVQTVFFEMIPISNLHGRGIFRYNRLVWLVLFAITADVFLQTMLNPKGSFISAFNSSNMVVLTIIVVIFCFFCAGVWLYLQQSDKRTVTE